METRAFTLARLAVGNRDDALDLVQDAMMRLAERYHQRPPEQWPALFHTILQRAIRDFYRRQKVRSRWRRWLDHFSADTADDGDGREDALARQPDRGLVSVETQLDNQRGMARLDACLQALPLRQQQAFLLRAWEGLSTEDTARALGISRGSVKTHYARARAALGQHLQDFRP